MSDQTPAPLATEIDALRPEIEKVLPAHVTPDKFMRVVLTAIAQTPELRDATRSSLLTSCVKAATDGLVPDGREAALVIFNTKVGRGYEKRVQYMPMVAGILKKVRNSGELESLSCNVVYERDEFDFWVDDAGEHILHKPLISDDRGGFRCVYAIAKTTSGGVYSEVMTPGQVDQVREVSRAKDSGPWVSWYDEMARKTCIRRLAKRLPMSTDLEGTITADDDMYELDAGGDQPQAGTGNRLARAALGVIPEPPPPLLLPVLSGDELTAAVKLLEECVTVDAISANVAKLKAKHGDDLPLEVAAKAQEMADALGKL